MCSKQNIQDVMASVLSVDECTDTKYNILYTDFSVD